jgi:HEPN domain-containing protein
MSAEGRRWLAYAQENLRAATVCLEGNLFNPCLQNAQQAARKRSRRCTSSAAFP